ncbi:Helix-turn-helix domain-containing protein [Micromonospora chokoriensis]|uniref:Helix-turn-helix domain-containing protein n=1 Tax=Micromonospora chokoriensis TaxID=356851 RepID=A0A1C4VN63_9ACTN|nr:Helix-turn-helix domain-containing protein [Micromonospora chokoriensis]
MADGQMTAAAFLIAELRRARARQGWSQDELAKAVNYSASMVSAVELGQQPPTAKYLELVDRALDTGGLFGRMSTELVSLDRAQPWLRGWQAILEQSRTIRWYEHRYVPGLFQTEAYARAVFEAGGLLESEEVDRRLADRMDRQQVPYSERSPHIVAVLDEAVLRRRVGGRKVMRDQALHLAKIGTGHPRVRLHVVPRSAEEYPGLGGQFSLATPARRHGAGLSGVPGSWPGVGPATGSTAVATGLGGHLGRSPAPAGVHRVAERGGRVVELTGADWRKSSRSNQDNMCVEVATNVGGVVGVRDSKDPDGPVLVVDAYSWRLFVVAPPR